mmetsp:Transcript_34120/g.77264  ORF Transcript_34120/g.77264 Transcript_34120/m.77264 type:complete len:220 (+) Transcript_34120:785-1444(+)
MPWRSLRRRRCGRRWPCRVAAGLQRPTCYRRRTGMWPGCCAVPARVALQRRSPAPWTPSCRPGALCPSPSPDSWCCSAHLLQVHSERPLSLSIAATWPTACSLRWHGRQRARCGRRALRRPPPSQWTSSSHCRRSGPIKALRSHLGRPAPRVRAVSVDRSLRRHRPRGCLALMAPIALAAPVSVGPAESPSTRRRWTTSLALWARRAAHSADRWSPSRG